MTIGSVKRPKWVLLSSEVGVASFIPPPSSNCSCVCGRPCQITAINHDLGQRHRLTPRTDELTSSSPGTGLHTYTHSYIKTVSVCYILVILRFSFLLGRKGLPWDRLLTLPCPTHFSPSLPRLVLRVLVREKPSELLLQQTTPTNTQELTNKRYTGWHPSHATSTPHLFQLVACPLIIDYH